MIRIYSDRPRIAPYSQSRKFARLLDSMGKPPDVEPWSQHNESSPYQCPFFSVGNIYFKATR